MKLISNILYIEFTDFIASGWKEDTIKKANLRNGPYWQMIPDPQDKRKVLVEFEALRPKDKEKIITRFGNPYDNISKDPIRKMLQPDPAADKFFNDYRYDNDKHLPLEHRSKYTTAAAWLNLLIKLRSEKSVIENDLKLTMLKFWNNVKDIIKADDIDLPTTYHRLLAKIDEYKESGYVSLIDWRFGNKLSAKIGKTENGFNEELYNIQMAFIRKASSLPNNFDAAQISTAVNSVFENQGWPTVSTATVYNICQANRHLSESGRRGKREYNNTIAMQHLRKRPEFPLYYCTLDGWTVELLYQDGSTYHNRMVVVIVLDAMNNYPLGYAIGDRENTDLIRMANRNASIHIAELFGDYYQPLQLQSDNYGIKNLTPFYQAMAKLHIPAAVGNAKAKVIEPYFKYLNKTYCQRFPNWYGFGITSKKDNQPNIEYLDKNKSNFPDKDGVIKQIELIIAEERRRKVGEYNEAWQSIPADKKILMSRMDMLMVYGKPTGYENTITGMGLQVTIAGEKLVYDSFDPEFRALQHLKWNVIYDECDLNTILVINEENKRRFVLETKRALPMDVMSMTPADHDYRSRISSFNKEREQNVISTFVSDNEIVADVMSNTLLDMNSFNEAALKLMFTTGGQQKEGIQDAKGLKRVQQIEQKASVKQKKQEDKDWNVVQDEYLKSKTDFNQYID